MTWWRRWNRAGAVCKGRSRCAGGSPSRSRRSMASGTARAEPRWYPLVVAASASTLIVSNIIAVKLVTLFGLTLPAAVILFPVVYILGDVLTEVYGYARARQAIWIGFGCNLLAGAVLWLAGRLPAAGVWEAQGYPGPAGGGAAHQAMLGFTPRRR